MCPPSGLLRQFRSFREGRISGSSQPIWSADETEIRTRQSAGRTGAEGHPTADAPALFGGGEDPYRAGRTARRGEHLRALPPRRHRRLDVLRLVQGVPGSRQAPVGGRHGTCRNLWRGERSSSGSLGVEGSRRRSHPGEPSAKKKHERGWGERGMRYPASEKAEIIALVEQSHLPAKRTLDKLGIPRATFYRWYDRYRAGGIEALADHRSRPDRVWNRIPDDVRGQIIDLALELPELSPRELAVRFTDERKYFVSEASVYRLLKAHDLITSPAYVVIKAANEFKDKTTAANQLWQTDFTYLKITGWGWYYLSTVLDDFSRYIVAWRLGPTMCASDVTATLDQALAASGLDHVSVRQRPRLLSDNGSSYVADDLATWLRAKDMQHVRGAPYHPQTQGKIERWHQTLKNRILLENYYLPDDLKRQVAAFVEHYNHDRYHESIGNVTPADVYFGRAETILAERHRIKRDTIANRRLQHQLQAA
ncbi:helix-turn-helix, Fis-type [Nitrobacter winogradskyi Nb-255]|uniref:Helix-turn-helix, Fis-type n=1 Tax=Nitrobacter winogradskyi (strain ATCC 25391 / DSM 10237 / CIP 104748 / NCIMB 11846 / Nb-255) TaxID=323098 RepID=Q3SMZ5_NITWN|nr:helix-turn-helix, Fis-type [Nitrobacter winogradskyi Nb-255]